MGKNEKTAVGAAIEEAQDEAAAAREQTSAAVDELRDMAATVLERLRRRVQQKADLRLVKAAK